MVFLEQIWGIARPFMEFGIVGVILFMIWKAYFGLERKYYKALEEKAELERLHGERVLRMSQEHGEKLVEVMGKIERALKPIEETLSVMVSMMEKISSEEN